MLKIRFIVASIIVGITFAQASYGTAPDIWSAAKAGDVATIQKLIRGGISVNAKDNEGNTALHYAAKQINTADFLIKNGADVNARNNAGDSPLFWVANSGNMKAVQFLIGKGAKADLRNDNGSTPLHNASCNGHVEVMKYLIDHGAGVNTLGYGSSPLAWACHNSHHGYLDAVKFLIAKGADVNQKFRYEGKYAADPQNQWVRGWTPLMFAIHDWGSTTDIIQYLLDKGADPNSESENGETPLYVALFMGNKVGNSLAIAKSLVQKGADIRHAFKKENLLFYAAAFNKPELIRPILGLGADINSRTSRGETALLAAAHSASIEVVRMLVENGADVNLSDQSGRTPLHAACERGELEIVKYLLGHRALKDTRDKSGMTPLAAALSGNHQEVAELLQETGKIDWDPIKPLAWDKVGDSAPGAADLEAGLAVTDSKYLYLGVKYQGENPMVDINLSFNGKPETQYVIFCIANQNRADIIIVNQGQTINIGSAPLRYNSSFLEVAVPLDLLGFPRNIRVNFVVKHIWGNEECKVYDEIPGWFEVKPMEGVQ